MTQADHPQSTSVANPVPSQVDLKSILEEAQVMEVLDELDRDLIGLKPV